MKKRYFQIMMAIAVFVLAVSVISSQVFAQENDDEWEFSLHPYLWVPTISGDLKFKSVPAGFSGTPHIELDSGDWLEDLEAAGILSSELRKGKWSLFSDFIYGKLSASESKVKAINFGGTLVTSSEDLGIDIELKGVTSTLVGGYEIINNKNLTMNLIGGVRYLWLEVDADWNFSAAVTGPLGGGQTFPRTGSLTEDDEVWSGVGGVRGRILLGDSNWFIPYYADVGAGGTKLTWNVFSGLAYTFEKWDVAIGYRHLVFEGKDDSIVDNLTLTGPLFGSTYRF